MKMLKAMALAPLILSSGCHFADDGSASRQAKQLLPEDGPWRQITFLTDAQKAAGRTVGGEGGQQITCMSWSKSDPSRVAFGVDVAGVWSSYDGGKTWKMRKGDLLANKMQAGIAIDPVNADVIYVWSVSEGSASDNWKGLYRTLDGGVSWKQVLLPKDKPAGGWNKQRFVFVPDKIRDEAFGRTACVLTCSNDKVVLSTDGGDSFAPFGKPFAGVKEPEKFQLTNIFLHREKPLSVVVGTSEGIFYVGEDGTVRAGQRLPEGLPVTAMARNPQNPSVFWAVVDKRLFKTMDCCDTFDEISLDKLKFANISVSAVDGNILYNPVGYMTIYYSHDGGYTWSAGKIDDSLSSRHSGGWSQGFAAHPANPKEALACFGDRIFRTVDGGKNWTDSSTGWTGTRSVTRASFFFHPDDKRVVGIGSLDWGFFYTVNGGSTWRYCWAQGVPRMRSVYSLLLDPRADWQSESAPQRILACSGGWSDNQMLIRSEDGGDWLKPSEGKQSWICYEDIMRKGNLAAYNSKRPGMVYIGERKSLDWGLAWTKMPQPADACCFSNPDVLYSIRKYADGMGLMRSKDCGETWEELKGRLTYAGLRDIEVAPDDPDCVFAATGYGLAVWRDGNWTRIGKERGLEPDAFGSHAFNAIAIDPRNPERIYAGAWADYMGNSSGVWASFDRGATWRNISQNLGPMSIWGMAVNPHDGAVYIGSSYGHWVLDNPKP